MRAVEMKLVGITIALCCLLGTATAFKCEEDGNYLKEGHCDAYYQCKDGVAEDVLCPDGLVFNPEDEGSRPCQLPRRIPCEGIYQDPQPTADCPRLYGLFIDGTAQECALYKDCTNGTATFSKCTRALAFNPKTRECDWPDLVPECDVEAYLKFSCPVPDREVAEGEFLYYKHETYMALYYMCLNGKPRLLDCGPRAIWDEDDERCVDDAKYRRIQYYKLLEAQKLNA